MSRRTLDEPPESSCRYRGSLPPLRESPTLRRQFSFRSRKRRYAANGVDSNGQAGSACSKLAPSQRRDAGAGSAMSWPPGRKRSPRRDVGQLQEASDCQTVDAEADDAPRAVDLGDRTGWRTRLHRRRIRNVGCRPIDRTLDCSEQVAGAVCDQVAGGSTKVNRRRGLVVSRAREAAGSLARSKRRRWTTVHARERTEA